MGEDESFRAFPQKIGGSSSAHNKKISPKTWIFLGVGAAWLVRPGDGNSQPSVSEFISLITDPAGGAPGVVTSLGDDKGFSV